MVRHPLGPLRSAGRRPGRRANLGNVQGAVTVDVGCGTGRPTATLGGAGARYGRVQLHGALFAPGAFPLHALIAPVLERIGHVVPGWGAFQILIVETS